MLSSEGNLPPILPAPLEFNGSLEEFYEKYAHHLLIPAPVVEEFHFQLVDYLNSTDPLFLIRQVKNQTRGETQRIKNGSQIRLTDNSPAWWLHYHLFTGQHKKFGSITEFIEATPSHMFDIKIKGHINDSGWSVAHIFDVKDRNTDFLHWSKIELIKRAVRNIHPCNYFYIAKHDRTWNEYGKDKNFLSFFSEKFSMKYQSIWNDFLKLIDANTLPASGYNSRVSYAYSLSKKSKKPKDNIDIKHSQFINGLAKNIHGCKVEYESSRLSFKADLIEPLGWDDYFCVITKSCVFMMSKREFYDVFSNVVTTKSYLEERIYHYPTLPKKAEKFKI